MAWVEVRPTSTQRLAQHMSPPPRLQKLPATMHNNSSHSHWASHAHLRMTYLASMASGLPLTNFAVTSTVVSVPSSSFM